MYVIKKNNGLFVAKEGRKNAYTNKLKYAQTYSTLASAFANRSPYEKIVEISLIHA